jgi:hypothetical protein
VIFVCHISGTEEVLGILGEVKSVRARFECFSFQSEKKMCEVGQKNL